MIKKSYCNFHLIYLPILILNLIFLQNVQLHKYHHREQFIEDVELILTNSIKYNGPDSSYTNIAAKIVEVAKENLAEVIYT